MCGGPVEVASVRSVLETSPLTAPQWRGYFFFFYNGNLKVYNFFSRRLAYSTRSRESNEIIRLPKLSENLLINVTPV